MCSKFWVPLIGGVVIGAAVAEIISRTFPGPLKRLEKKVGKGIRDLPGKVSKVVAGASEAFADGYRSSAGAAM